MNDPLLNALRKWAALPLPNGMPYVHCSYCHEGKRHAFGPCRWYRLVFVRMVGENVFFYRVATEREALKALNDEAQKMGIYNL